MHCKLRIGDILQIMKVAHCMRGKGQTLVFQLRVNIANIIRSHPIVFVIVFLLLLLLITAVIAVVVGQAAVAFLASDASEAKLFNALLLALRIIPKCRAKAKRASPINPINARRHGAFCFGLFSKGEVVSILQKLEFPSFFLKCVSSK